MNHKKRLLKTMSCALTLAIACSCGAASEKIKETEPEKESVSESVSEIEESAALFETEETTAPVAKENPEYLIGADGNPVPTAIGRTDESGDQWHFDDFTFYRDATGLTFYDDSYMEMEDSWKVLRVGDVFGSLTVTGAYCEYHELALQYENAKINHLPDHDAIWYSRNVTFDGTVTLSGRLFADMREGAFGGGVLLFQPDAISLKEAGFPMLKSVHFSWARDSVYAKDIYPIEDSDVFILGDAVEYEDIFDYASFTDENESISVYAQVQLTDIKVNYGTPTGSYPCGDPHARLLSVKIIDLPVSSDSEEPTLPKTEDLPSYSENTETTAPETSAEDASFPEDRLTEEMLEALLEKNREFYGMYLFYRGIKWIGKPADTFEIEFDNYESFRDFRNSIYSTYTEEYAAYLLENYLNKGEKSFFEDENGKIFMNHHILGIAVVDEFRYGRESYTFQIISSDSSVCEFLFSFRMWNEYGTSLPGVLCGEDTIVTLKCKAVREKDGWRLPYMICDDYDQTEVMQ